MGHIRAFTKDDIPDIANLHMRVFRHSDRPASQALRTYFEDIFSQNPWYDETLPSLVYQENTGKIVGFFGVVPRQMSMHGRPIRVAIGTQFMVDPGNRSKGIGTQLVKTFFSGPQELSISDRVTNAGRMVLERAGATTALLYKFRWTRLLRPSRFIMSFLCNHWRPLRLVEWFSRPCCHVVDTLAARLPYSPLHQVASATPDEEPSVKTLLTCLSTFPEPQVLRPEYDHRSLTWLLDMVAQKTAYGKLWKAIVYDANHTILGWYLYYLKPGGIGEVIQIGARKHTINEVLDHLFSHAWQRGALALSGRIEPGFMQALAHKSCLFKHGYEWMLVHAKKPELLHAVHRGDAFLTRLEGEWWMHFEEI